MDTSTEPTGPAGQEPDGRRRIGEIFVELGFITSAQLEDALAVQRRTGGRIGEILVEQGSLTRLDLASALAEHWEPQQYASTGRSGPSPGGAPFGAQPEDDRLRQDRLAAAELERRLEAAEQRLAAEQQPRRGRSRWRRPGAVDDLHARVAGCEAALAALEASELHRREQLGVELRDRLAALDERLLELSVRLDRVARDDHDRLAGLAEDLRAEAAAKAAELDARLREPRDETTGRGWLAFAPTAAGYRLVELPGAPADLGATIELDSREGTLVVTRYGPSPLPFDERLCAFLDRA